MKNHTKVYLEYFGIDEENPYIPCEICSQRAIDIHHIRARGMGGSKKKDDITNLMALCRTCDLQYGDIQEMVDTLQELHDKVINSVY